MLTACFLSLWHTYNTIVNGIIVPRAPAKIGLNDVNTLAVKNDRF